MATTYAILETNSGFVWGIVTAANPIAACRAMDESARTYGRTYAEGSVADLRTTGGAYDVRLAPAGLENDQRGGDDDSLIADVGAMPRAAVIIASDADAQ